MPPSPAIPPDAERTDGDRPAEPLRTETLAFIFTAVSDAYKAQTDMDESVWRTMPFIAALFGLAVTVVRFVPAHVSFQDGIVGSIATIAYLLSIISFALAFAYFWQVAMPRYFETPAKSVELRDHALAISQWYVSIKTPDKTIDAKVANDMRSLLVDQLSNATETNRPVVEKRLAARSRTILLLLAGFGFISVSEVLTFLVKAMS